MIAWLRDLMRRPERVAQDEDVTVRVAQGYARSKTELARMRRECDARRLAYDERTMHRPDSR